MSSPDPATVVGVGTACLLGFGAGVYRAASFRSDFSNKWTGRIEIAVAALHEQTLAQLGALRDEIDAKLPRDDPESPGFAPEVISLDPGPLSDMAIEAAKLHRDQLRMERAFIQIKRLGLVWIAGFALLLVPTIAFSLYYADIAAWKVLWWIALATLLPGVLLVSVGGAAYVFYSHRLGLAQEHSGTSDERGSGA